jgi:uncharacterized protein
MLGELKREEYGAVLESSSDWCRLTSTIRSSSFATTSGGVELPSIRDLVAAIRQRDGVDAAIVLGHDGLLIDSQLAPGLDAEDMAARIPAIINSANEFGAATGRGELLTAVLEHRTGLAIMSVLSNDAILLVLVTPLANIGQLLFELRRNREHIAALV